MCVVDQGNECRVVRRRRGQIQCVVFRTFRCFAVAGRCVYSYALAMDRRRGNRDTTVYAVEMKVFRIIECHSMELTSTVGVLSSRGEGHYAR